MSVRDERFHSAPHRDVRDPRSEGRRDRDRILYSSAFRRLAGITQVAPANDLHPIHNRLTHTLEVAQIGRSLAENLLRVEENQTAISALGGLDPDVVEAACLAHDLGHPPFGHVAEAELDDILKNSKQVADGYEGNPQTFRILTKLAMRSPDHTGLNLTRATLCAVLKYPWQRGPADTRASKWGAYASEEDEFRWAVGLLAEPEQRGLEAALMDWADDVAYAVHDVEDFYRIGLIPLDRLTLYEEGRNRFVESELRRNPALAAYNRDDLAAAFNDIVAGSPIQEPYSGRKVDRYRLRMFTSSLVSRYVDAVTIDPTSKELRIPRAARMEVAIFKGLTWQYVIESRALIGQRYGHRTVIRSLFSIICEAGASTRDRRILPEFYRELLDSDPTDKDIARIAADLIASMTEAHVIVLHHRLTGISMGASLDPILP